MADRNAGGSGRQTPCIRAQGLVKSFAAKGRNGSIDVLAGLSLDVAHGETVAVVGASGIGKSTLLHVLGTLERPDRGSVHLDGQDVFAMGDVALARFRNRYMGFVFQFHHLLPEFTAVENTAMPGLIGGMPRREARERAEAILERVGLSDRLEHRVGELSGGEQQRVAVARALVLEPRVLLADEPTGNLDVRTGERIHSLLRELNEERGTSMVVVTHNPDLARQMSRQVTLADGRIVSASTT
ncbi:MAG: ABC transporter ATP-binding protein [Desulfatibacillaceae bacterium]